VAQLTSADVLVARLASAGTRALFGVPGGGGNLDLIDAAGRSGLPFVLTQTETAGVLMAAAQAEVTGAPGAFLCTLGPGVASAVNGLAHAYLDRAPVIVFTDTIAPADRGRYQHQNLDHRMLVAGAVKASLVLSSGGVEEVIRTAIETARAWPPGPVHVDCNPGALSAPASGDAAVPIQPDPSDRVDPLHPDVIDRLRSSHRPIVLAGLGVRSRAAADAVRQLCGRRGLPVLVTYKAKGVVADGDPLFAGVFTLGAVERPIVESADSILALGLDPVELLPRPWPYTQPVIAAATGRPGTDHVPAVATVVGDAAAAVAALDEHLARTTGWQAHEIEESRRRQREAVEVACEGLSPSRAIDAIAAAAPRGCRVTIDAGAHMFPATTLWPAVEPGRFLMSNGLSTMGYALPAAIGAALLDRGEPVLAITGDGGLLMCLGELATLGRERLPVIVIVFADEELSLIRIKQDQRGLPTAGVRLGEADWCALGRSFGLAAFSAGDVRGLERAVEGALGAGGPAIVAARIDPRGYLDMMKKIRG
jgi:acetolactate synthase-1/2/3 large subunit